MLELYRCICPAIFRITFKFEIEKLNLFMKTLKIEIHNDQEKKNLLAFLDSLSYQYRIDSDDYILSDEQVQKMIERKANFLAGKTTSRPWSEIKQKYERI